MFSRLKKDPRALEIVQSPAGCGVYEQTGICRIAKQVVFLSSSSSAPPPLVDTWPSAPTPRPDPAAVVSPCVEGQSRKMEEKRRRDHRRPFWILTLTFRRNIPAPLSLYGDARPLVVFYVRLFHLAPPHRHHRYLKCDSLYYFTQDLNK